MTISKKEEYLAVLAHQLKNPVTNIRNYLANINEGHFGAVTPQLRKRLEFISSYAAQFGLLIDDIIDLMRVRTGSEKLKQEAVSLSKLVREIVAELRKEAQAKKLTIKLIAEKKIPVLKLDRSMMRAVFTNVIDNAIKYSPKGTIEITLKKNKNSVILSVRDRGIGLTSRELKKIFRKFQRGTQAQKFHQHGLGLGLYFAEIAIKAHSGKLWAESEGRGRGSTFFIKLPFK